MFKSFTTAALALAAAATALPSAAVAQSWERHAPRYEQAGGFQTVGYRDGRRYRDYRYRDRGRYYRGSNRCYDKGNGGLAIGGIAGGLLGNTVVGRGGDKTLGTILGAGVGALAGRAIDKSDGARC